MHDFVPVLYDAGCVYASMEWTPLMAMHGGKRVGCRGFVIRLVESRAKPRSGVWKTKFPETEAFTELFSQLKRFPTEIIYKKAQLSLTNPRDACEKFARFT